jgi:integrase
MTKSTDDWTFRWKNSVRPTRTPGLYEIRDGGYLYRRMVTDPTTGKEREVKRVMRDADETTAAFEMNKAVLEVKAGKLAPSLQPRLRFAEYASQLFKQKSVDELRSNATIDRWEDTLIHLLDETTGDSGKKVPGLGEVYVHMLEEPIKQWRLGIAELIAAGDYAPTTANGWLSILKVITKSLAYEHKLPRDPAAGIKKFDLSEHATYTEEAPNALPPERAGEFLAIMYERFPQHYAMTFLGFITGLRPSSLRPLRRSGPEADVKWDTGRLVVRRSQTIGDRVVRTTKQKKHYAIDLPKDATQTLRWHVDTQLRRPEQKASDLLFPSEVGGFRARSVLDKPFNAVAKEMKLGFRFTARGMRRTFQDMARLARLESIVTRSISGHATEAMQQHYSTVQSTEQREGIAQVIQLFGKPESTAACALTCAPTDSSCALDSSDAALPETASKIAH